MSNSRCYDSEFGNIDTFVKKLKAEFTFTSLPFQHVHSPEQGKDKDCYMMAG